MIEFHDDYHYKPVWDGTDENLKEKEEYVVSTTCIDWKFKTQKI